MARCRKVEETRSKPATNIVDMHIEGPEWCELYAERLCDQYNAVSEKHGTLELLITKELCALHMITIAGVKQHRGTHPIRSIRLRDLNSRLCCNTLIVKSTRRRLKKKLRTTQVGVSHMYAGNATPEHNFNLRMSDLQKSRLTPLPHALKVIITSENIAYIRSRHVQRERPVGGRNPLLRVGNRQVSG